MWTAITTMKNCKNIKSISKKTERIFLKKESLLLKIFLLPSKDPARRAYIFIKNVIFYYSVAVTDSEARATDERNLLAWNKSEKKKNDKQSHFPVYDV